MQRTLVILSLLAAGSAGCGSSNGLNLGKVHGKVTFKGEPVPFGQIMFMPDTGKGTSGPPALGSISKDGSYSLSTEESGDGAIVGVHKVSITGLDPKPVVELTKNIDDMTDKEVMLAKGKVGQQLTAKKETGPTFRARDGSVYKVLTPQKLMNPDTSEVAIKVERGSNTKNIVIKEDGSVSIE